MGAVLQHAAPGTGHALDAPLRLMCGHARAAQFAHAGACRAQHVRRQTLPRLCLSPCPRPRHSMDNAT